MVGVLGGPDDLSRDCQRHSDVRSHYLASTLRPSVGSVASCVVTTHDSMQSVTRRDLLGTVGTGALLGVAATSGAAQERHRVFVSPVDRQSQAEEALRDHEGRVTATYFNWEFVAGIAPRRTEPTGPRAGRPRRERLRRHGGSHHPPQGGPRRGTGRRR